MPVSRTFAAALTAGALIWSAALLLAPVGLRGRNPWLATASAYVYEAAGLICHQRSERSFHIGGVQLPVCARCTGLYVSGAVGAVAAGIGWRRRPQRTRAVLLAAAVPSAVTVVLEFAGLSHPSNVMRALSALPLGGAAGWVFVRSLRAERDAARAGPEAQRQGQGQG
jgi:uncharacterized membrane protein